MSEIPKEPQSSFDEDRWFRGEKIRKGDEKEPSERMESEQPETDGKRRETEAKLRRREAEEDKEAADKVRAELGVALDDQDADSREGVLKAEFELKKIVGKGDARKAVARVACGALNGTVFSRQYGKYGEVLKEANNPESEQYYLNQVDRYNIEQERRAEELGFDRRIAFVGHLHSRGAEDWRDGSDGSLTPEELFEQYKKMAEDLKAQGYDDVQIALTDHNSIENSIKLAEMLAESGVARPLIGIEVATAEGYEILAYTTDVDKLREFAEFLEPGQKKITRYAATGFKGREIVDKLAADGFVMGLPHPNASKAITFGGTMTERLASDSDLAEMMGEHMTFYEAMNWFQNNQGSNALSVEMLEDMVGRGILPFAATDFHSSVRGNEDLPFGGMYTELRTDRDITSGEDLLEMFRAQKGSSPDDPRFVAMMRGTPATDSEYMEHMVRAGVRTATSVVKALFSGKKKGN